MWLPTLWLALALAIVVVLGAWEWAALVGVSNRGKRLVFSVVTAVIVAALAAQLPALRGLMWVYAAALVWWVFALVAIVKYQNGGALWWPHGPAALVLGWLVVLPPWLGIVALHSDPRYGPGWVLLLLCVIWVADIGAYFCGRKFGRHRLASRVSPGKTIEGILGALVVGALSGVAGVLWLSWEPLWLVTIVVLATVLMSVLGDLAESVMKRQAGVKDSGALLPGHGGVLDRIDSLTAAVPFFMVFAHALRSPV